MPKVQMSTPLRGQSAPPDDHQIGSLGNLSTSVLVVPGHRVAGGRIRDVLSLFFTERQGLIDRCCDSLGTDRSVNDLFAPADLALLRSQVGQLVATQLQVAPPQIATEGIQGELLHLWATWAGDPAAHVAHWLRDGAPAGVTVDFDLDGVLQPIADENPLGIDQLASDAADFANYRGIEDDPATSPAAGFMSATPWSDSASSLAANPY